MKTCSRCGESKPISEFTKDKRRKSGIGGMCQKCKNDADWRRRDLEKPVNTKPYDLNVLSLGAGVQSSTVLMMSELGELPRLDYAVFADTQWEPDAVYENLEWLKAHTTIPIHTVSAGDISETADEFCPMPLFTSTDGMLKRQCTSNYKVRPIRSFMYDKVQRKVSSTHVRQWIGISADEHIRMRDSEVLWIDNWYPLVENNITRDDCLEWMRNQGFPEPPRSACIGCPYRSGKEWRALTDPEFSRAVQFDEKLKDEWFLHRKGPLRDVRSSDVEGGWANECEGHCGI